MSTGTAIAQAVLADPALLETFLADIGVIVKAVERLHDTAHALSAPKASEPAPIPELAPAPPAAMKTDDASMENYDAEALVALRADHRADNHPAGGCRVCEILTRRLGSL